MLRQETDDETGATITTTAKTLAVTMEIKGVDDRRGAERIAIEKVLGEHNVNRHALQTTVETESTFGGQQFKVAVIST